MMSNCAKEPGDSQESQDTITLEEVLTLDFSGALLKITELRRGQSVSDWQLKELQL